MLQFIIAIFLFAFVNSEKITPVVLVKNRLPIPVQYPSNLTGLSTLKEFVRIVEENQLNVSVIVSNGENWSNGNLKQLIALSLTFPVNSEYLTSTTLKPEVYNSLSKAANEDGLTVTGIDASNGRIGVVTNNRQGNVVSHALSNFVTIRNGKTGFVFDEKNYVAQYTFLTTDEAGTTKKTRVLYGDVDVVVVDKSANLKDEQITVIKKAVVDSLFSYDETDVPKAIYVRLTEQLKGFDWEVAIDVGENSYLDSSTWVDLKIFERKVLVYAA